MQASLSIVPIVALLLFVVVAPDLVVHDGLYGYDLRRVLELIVVAAGCSAVAISKRSRNDVAQALAEGGVATVAAAVFFALGLASAIQATFVDEALLEVAAAAALALTALCCGRWGATQPVKFRRAACVAVVLSAAVSTVQYGASFAAAVVAAPETVDLFPAYLTPRFFAQWQTWTLPLLCIPAALLPPARVVSRRAAGLLAAAWWVPAFLSGGRGTLFSLAVAVVALACVGGASARAWLLRQRLALALGATAAAAVAFFFPSVVAGSSTLGRFLTAGDSGRSELWGSAMRLAVDHPLLGIGPQHYAYTAGHDVAHPHNLPLQIAAEWGIPALAAFTFAAVLGLVGLMRGLSRVATHGDDTTAAIRYALTVSVLAALVHSCLSGIAIMPLSQAAGCLVAAWLIAETAAERRSARRAGGALNAAVLAVSVGVLAVLIVCGAPAATARIADPIERSIADGLRFRPRMWRDGRTNFAIALPDPVHDDAD